MCWILLYAFVGFYGVHLLVNMLDLIVCICWLICWILLCEFVGYYFGFYGVQLLICWTLWRTFIG